MDVTEIIAELDDHGFADTSTERKLSAINFAIKNLSQRRAWPFLEKVVAITFDGTSPVPVDTPADLRTVMKLIDTTTGRRIRPQRVDDMEEKYGSQLTVAGDPFFYYFEGTELRIFQVPGVGQSLRLRYLRTAPAVVEGGDEATIVVPPDYHEAIIFRALMRLYDLDDDPELAGRFEAHYENVLAQMTEALVTQQKDAPDFIHVVDDDDWDYDTI